MQVWRLDKFKSLIGQTLSASVTDQQGAVEVQVISVHQSNCLGEDWESFSVVFICSEQLQQGSYQLSHDEYGNMDVFMSPNSENEAEAVFNYQLAA